MTAPHDPSDPSINSRVLDAPMDPDANDAGASSVRDYLHRLLAEVWKNGDDFSGKRPFGNSGWHSELYTALARADLLEGEFDEDGYLETVDARAADQLITDAITSLFTAP